MTQSRLEIECKAMISLLKDLEHEEHDLRTQNEILAREALLLGFCPTVLEPPAPKRRRISLATNKNQEKRFEQTAGSPVKDGG
jgi:hypothetical protein